MKAILNACGAITRCVITKMDSKKRMRITKRKSKWIVYDDKDNIVIITTDRNLALWKLKQPLSYRYSKRS